jgi:hypothetical protein
MFVRMRAEPDPRRIGTESNRAATGNARNTNEVTKA